MRRTIDHHHVSPHGRRFRIPGNIIRFSFILTVLPGFFTGILSGQTINRVGTTSAAFLKIGVGARALGMGEAVATASEDITAMFWNPAGLAMSPRKQILLNHYNYLADLTFEYGAVSLPVGNLGTFGAFVSYLGMPDIERTTIQWPDGNGELVSANSFSAGLGYARSLTDRFAIGGNVKFIKETIWHSSASGVAFDLGLLYRAFFKNIRIGMSISNFGGDLQMNGRDMLIQHDINDVFAGNNQNINGHLDTEAYPLPVLFRVGLSANLTKDIVPVPHTSWVVAVDAVHPNDNREYMNAGTELMFYDFFAMRGGFRQLLLNGEEREGGLTFGFGLNLKLMQYALLLDYANVDFGRLDHTHKFSLILSF
ncbi:PorV/PorQ family protein [bacterium]|nr:PorV/PorQ family protein [bacterium]